MLAVSPFPHQTPTQMRQTRQCLEFAGTDWPRCGIFHSLISVTSLIKLAGGGVQEGAGKGCNTAETKSGLNPGCLLEYQTQFGVAVLFVLVRNCLSTQIANQPITRSCLCAFGRGENDSLKMKL